MIAPESGGSLQVQIKAFYVKIYLHHARAVLLIMSWKA